MTSAPEPKTRRRFRWAVTAAIPAALVLGACSDADPPDDPVTTSPSTAVSTVPSAAFVFRDDLCERADWSILADIGTIEPTEYDLADYDEHSGRMDCVRFFTRAEERPGDALMLRTVLDASENNATEIEKRLTEQSWKPIERSPWTECALNEDDLGFTILCWEDNLLVELEADTIAIRASAEYREAALAFIENIHGLLE